jgi:hypothetical protein
VGSSISVVLVAAGAMDITTSPSNMMVDPGFGFILWLVFRVIFVCGIEVLTFSTKVGNKNKGAKSPSAESRSTRVAPSTTGDD